jgi:hypothetical protein
VGRGTLGATPKKHSSINGNNALHSRLIVRNDSLGREPAGAEAERRDNYSTIRIYCWEMMGINEENLAQDALVQAYPWSRPGYYFRMNAGELRPTTDTEPVGPIGIYSSKSGGSYVSEEDQLLKVYCLP